MIVCDDPPLHLTYCLNIHPGESWADCRRAIRRHALRVRRAVCAGEPFGLGLRLSSRAARELLAGGTLSEFAAFLEDNGLYVFTINGFPYGTFHGEPVGRQVYRPDWQTPERLDYTVALIDILAALLPAGLPGSISTVPGTYKAWAAADADGVARRIARNLAAAAAHADRARVEAGRDICIALEPEPDCLLETTGETVAFFRDVLGDEHAVRRHIGVCLDTAHAAVEFEDPAASLTALRAAGVRVGKVQLSAALRVGPGTLPGAVLRGFVEPVYLHQAALRGADGHVQRYADLPDALAAAGPGPLDGELRVHFHVPLFFTAAGGLASTSDLLGEAFWQAVRRAGPDWTGQLEIETYTFDVLPAEARSADVVDSIVREYRWVLHRLAGPGASP